jgi:hypothetical protein
MSRYLFVGPSLPDAGAVTAGSGLKLLAPIAAGDLLRLPLCEGDTIGIVDGYFHHARAVRHKEILDVLSRGIPVLGASSMGALRAAELDVFGMKGIGQIYSAYAAGTLHADDEVALLHAPAEANYLRLSDPLVNIRATLQSAAAAGVCPVDLVAQIIAKLADMPYGKRSYQRVIAAGSELGAGVATLSALRDFFATSAVDTKRDDAIALIAALHHPQTPPVLPAERVVNRTLFLYAWQLEAEGSNDKLGTGISDLAALRACQLLATDYPAFFNALVLRWLVDDCVAAGHREADVSRDADSLLEAAIAHGVHVGLYAFSDGDRAPDFLGQWVSPSERALPPRQQIGRFLVRSFRIAPAITWDELPLLALRANSVLATGRQIALLARDVNAQTAHSKPDFDIDILSADRIEQFFAQRWGVAREDLELAALDRGFESIASMIAAARPLYLLARYNSERLDLRMESLTATESHDAPAKDAG